MTKPTVSSDDVFARLPPQRQAAVRAAALREIALVRANMAPPRGEGTFDLEEHIEAIDRANSGKLTPTKLFSAALVYNLGVTDLAGLASSYDFAPTPDNFIAVQTEAAHRKAYADLKAAGLDFESYAAAAQKGNSP